jgi:hypothetical protein
MPVNREFRERLQELKEEGALLSVENKYSCDPQQAMLRMITLLVFMYNK